MKNWIQKNPLALSAAAAAVSVLMFCLAAAGCQVGDLIKVNVPSEVKEAVGVEGDVTLTEVPIVWEDWDQFVKRNTDRFESQTKKSYELLGFINTATDIAIASAESAAPAFPGGAIVFGLLAGTAGLFMKKPGADKVLAKEKEDSYNAGIKRAEDLGKIWEEQDGTA